MQPISANEYTLWLEPGGEERIEFQRLIHDLATRAHTPVFQPHLTLLSRLIGDEVVLIKKLDELSAQQLPIHGIHVKTGDRYHKCLYVECSNSRPLTDLHSRAGGMFPNAPAEFHPHISLAYGLDASTLRDTFVSELAKKRFTFTAHRLSLWHAYGLPHEWRCVASRTLSK